MFESWKDVVVWCVAMLLAAFLMLRVVGCSAESERAERELRVKALEKGVYAPGRGGW